MTTKRPNGVRWLHFTGLLAGLVFLTSGCGSGYNLGVPAVISFDPAFAVSGANARTVTITGNDFSTFSSVVFNGSAKTMTYISPQKLSFQLTPADQATAGSYSVSVSNPSAKGAVSAIASFPVWETLDDQSTDLVFSIPPFGVPSQTSIDSSITGQSKIQIQIERIPPQFETEFYIVVFDNPTHLSLSQWFEKNVDVNNILVTDKAVQGGTLRDGSAFIYFGGSVPDEYFDAGGAPPLYYAYKLSDSGKIIAIAQSQSGELGSYGYSSPQSIKQLELQVLETAHF